MKKNVKSMKRTAFLLGVCIVMTGCSGNSGGTSQKETVGVEQDGQVARNAQDEQMVQDVETADAVSGLPICEAGTVELTYAGYDSWLPNYSYADGLPVWNEFERRTGVKINYEVYPYSEWESAVQIRLASGESLPDITQIPPAFTNTGVMKYAQDGVIIELDELIEQYAPNIRRLLETDPYFASMMYAPDGHIYSVMDVMYPINEYVPVSIAIRKDWLDKLNLKEPENYEDWIEVLTAFATQDPNGNGIPDEIPFLSHDMEGTVGIFGTGGGFPYTATNDNRYAYDEDGKARFLFATEEAKGVLEFLNQLYSQGLIYKELQAQSDVLESYIAQDVVGAYCGQPVDWLSRANSLAADACPDVNYVMIAPPADESGSRNISMRFPTGTYYGITSACEDPVAAIRWIDYVGYSEEGNLLKDYGIEGETFVFDEEGNPQFTDYIMNNPDGYSPHDACRTVGSAPAVLVYDTSTNFLQKYEGSIVEECSRELAQYMVDAQHMMLPSVEENSTYNSIWPDLQTYYTEAIYKFISGAEPLDNFDRYLQTMDDIGLQEILDIKTAQYQRYLEATQR